MPATVIYDPELGDIQITPRRSTSRISARWRDGHLLVITPYGVSRTRILEAIEAMRPRLLPGKPQPMFEIGRPLHLDGPYTYYLEHTSLTSGRITAHPMAAGMVLRISSDLIPGTPQTDTAISRLMIRTAHCAATAIILPRARELAHSLNLEVREWAISHGRRTLGTCTRDRRITLSSLLLFLPAHLRDYIIYHELAHLTEMNHSARFHRLCDTYCSGREAELIKELRTYRWPILR